MAIIFICGPDPRNHPENFNRIEEIAKQIGVSVRTIKSLLVTLENESIIKRVNGKRYGYWIVIN